MTKSEFLSSDLSPVNWLLNHINNWTKSENTGKSALATRTTALVAGSVFALLSATYQTLAFVVKAPGTVLRYTFFFIPVKKDGEWWTLGGYIFSNNGFSATGMLKHVLKTAAFIIDIGLFPVVGLISPVANIKMHEIFKLIIIEQTNNCNEMKVSQIKAPQRRPATSLTNNNKKVESNKSDNNKKVESNKSENKKENYERSSSSIKKNCDTNNQGSIQEELARKLALRNEKAESEQINNGIATKAEQTEAPLVQLPHAPKRNEIKSGKVHSRIELKEIAVPSNKGLNLQEELARKLALINEKAKSEQIKSEKESVIQINEKEEAHKELKDTSCDFNSALNQPEAIVIQKQITNIFRRELPKPKLIEENLIKVGDQFYDYDPSTNPFASPIDFNEEIKRQFPVRPKPTASLNESKKIIPMKLPSTDSFGNQELLEEFSKEPASIKDYPAVIISTSQLDVSIEKPLKENSQISDSQSEKTQQEEETSAPIKKFDSSNLENRGPALLFSINDLKKKAQNLKKISVEKTESEEEDSWEAEIEAEKKEPEKVKTVEELTLIEEMAKRRKALEDKDNINIPRASSTNIKEKSKVEESKVETVEKVKAHVQNESPIIRPVFKLTENDFLVKKGSLNKVVIEENKKNTNISKSMNSSVDSFREKLRDAGM